MPYPHEGLGGPMNNYIDDVREFLDSKHAGSYMVYNLAEKTYEEEKLHNKVRYSCSFTTVTVHLVSVYCV